MNKRKLLTALATIGPLLLWAGAALAANSGIAAIDTPLNTMGTIIKAGGYGVGAVGTIGVIHHIRSGSWLGMLEHLGLTVVGSSAVINYSAYAAALGGTGAALIHPVLSHPATPLVVQAARHLIS
jgi:hypothetical protein